MTRSQIDGLMHNRGHDIHASILLGTAGIPIAKAAPNEGSDTALVAARMAIELPARYLDIANKPVVISVTQFLADGNAGNVITADADVSGTIRSFENISLGENGEPSLEEKLDQLVSRMASEAAVNYDWAVRPGAPATRNDPALFEQIIAPLGRTWPGMLDTPWAWHVLGSFLILYRRHARPVLLHRS
ncbi:hypothetical protein AAFG07_34530 [Bradyrhizobium sp. B097]|uniref:hypothetical protein n=1 Tax=Bradyrhizobium sp. B097 TaxID=3140244 RepID=UPI003184310C